MNQSGLNLRSRQTLCALFLLLLACSVPPPLSADSSSAGSPDTQFRVGFSKSMFIQFNENDVKASMKAWAQILFNERGIPMDPDISVLNSHEEISRALRGKLVDALSLTTDEYWALEKEMRSTHVVVALYDGEFTEEYLLLVHRESGFERIEDLRGRSIALLRNERMSLATVWVNTLVAKARLEPPPKHFGRITQLSKLPGVILPVFFRQNDACVVTRRGFKTMSELNPQVGQRLKVLATSPQVVPAAFFFRGDFSTSLRDKVLVEFDKIHMSPAGQQALNIFQSDRLSVQPISVLNSAFELLEDHKRLRAATHGVKASETEPMRKEARAGAR